jgi:acyl carrier protein phosphodiesterase
VDAYTDSHPVVKESMYRLFPRWGRYSGILVDMVYDHFLAADWHRYTDEPLRQFLDGKYTVMREIAPTLPEELGQPLLGLIRSDRMMTYRELEGLRYALQWISKRFTRKVIHLDHAVEDFAELYAPLQEDFHRFFPELMQYFAETAAAERAASEEAET